MKNRWKHILIPVLAMALCLSLAACGNSDDVAGEDWRTTGVVVGSGTITHDGESVDVLVTADPNSAAFYRDQEEQVLFDSVAFPETIEDISSSAFQISFDDQNGDGESDVLVEIGHEDMSNTTMLWLWDPQERYLRTYHRRDSACSPSTYPPDRARRCRQSYIPCPASSS